ncbi:MAG TPA: PP2C family protein-serine/threonine phosphatase [Streptosporangiaceae bacterium]|nr:PP2C family protein-serine/threonine phosphatase [Streptosporangiaceae bacterium]
MNLNLRVPARSAGRQPGPRPATQLLPAIVPFAVMGILAAADVAAGPAYGFLPLLSLGPALAAVLLSPARTALVGALAAVVSLPLAGYDGLLGSRHAAVALATIAGVTAAGAVASASRLRRERELASVKAVADAVQRVLLRPVPGRVGGVSTAVRYASATASAQVGGDLYEVINSGSMLRLIVGDVAGQGLPAVGTAAVVLGAFRESAYDAPGLPEIAARIEASLQRRQAAEEFVTAVLAQVPAGQPQIEILNCGHPPPLLLSGAAPGRLIEPGEPGLPLGLAQLCPDPRQAAKLDFQPGQRVLFYTDGISEARDNAGVFYPIERCASLLNGPDIDAALEQLHADIVRHASHQLRDDATMLLVGRDPAPVARTGHRHGNTEQAKLLASTNALPAPADSQSGRDDDAAGPLPQSVIEVPPAS